MKEHILKEVEGSIKAINILKEEHSITFIEKAARMIANTYRKGGKIIIAGNGGSLCDSMHFAEELTGYFRKKRKALPAIALCEPGHLTCVANDEGYDYVFSRGVEAYAKKEDVFIALTTSGNSQNLYNAVLTAKTFGAKTISFLGKTGGTMKGISDLEWLVEGFKTSDRIQEVHMAAIHIIIEIIEKELFYSTEKLKEMKSKLTAIISG